MASAGTCWEVVATASPRGTWLPLVIHCHIVTRFLRCCWLLPSSQLSLCSADPPSPLVSSYPSAVILSLLAIVLLVGEKERSCSSLISLTPLHPPDTIASGRESLDVGVLWRAEGVQPAAGCVQRGAKRVQRGGAKRVRRDPEPEHIPCAAGVPRAARAAL